MRTWSYFMIVGAVAGCSGKTIDAGTNDAGGSGGSGSGGGSANSSSDVPTGVFKGYIESFMFPSGSDTVVMNLALGSAGTVTGTVFFGDGPPLPPPTNPNVGYPPGANYEKELGISPEGFSYTALQGVDAASRVTLQVDPRQLFKKWCELQTMIYPIYNGNNPAAGIEGYNCLPDEESMYASGSCVLVPEQGPPTPVDCNKMYMCLIGSNCTCTATSCTVPVGTTGDIRFDMQLSGNDLNGSVIGLPGSEAYNVHMTRSP